ncbi:SPBc2 prophage-derived glycosyltransferase SunS [compost metagenome]
MALKIAKLTGTQATIPHELRGNRAFETGDLDAAVTHFLAALEQDEQNADLYLKVGSILLQQGKVDKAIIALKRSLELAPYQPDAYNAMGHALFQLEFFGAAEAFFARVLKFDARHATAKSNLVEARRRLRDGETAMPPEFDTIMALLEAKDPTISLCMIAKNEELFLEDCLASVRGLVDEIVLVDTGSTDSTVAIAERFGAKVFHSPWQGDFAAARNASLAHASSDWILVLDADEVLPSEAHEDVKRAIRNAGNAGYYVQMENLLGDEGQERETSMLFRLFQNRKNIHFQGLIHEEASFSAEATGLPLGVSDIRVTHRGYLAPVVEARDKGRRNLDILLKQVQDEPTNAYVYFQLGKTYWIMGSYGEAEKAYQQSLKLLEEQKASTNLGYRSTVYAGLVGTYVEMKAYDEALNHANAGLRLYPRSPDLHFLRGRALLELGRLPEAVRTFQTCRSLKDQKVLASHDPSTAGYKAAYALGLAYSRMGKAADAIAAFETALAECAYPHADIQACLGLAHMMQRDFPAAMPCLIAATEIDPRNFQAWFNLGLICESYGEHQEAYAAFSRAHELRSDDGAVTRHLALTLIRLQRSPEAEALLRAQVDRAPDAAAERALLGVALLCNGNPAEAKAVWSAVGEAAAPYLALAGLLAGEAPKLPTTENDRAAWLEVWTTTFESLLRAGRYGEVEALLEAAPSAALPGLVTGMGRVLNRNGLAEEALAFLLKAQESNAQDAEMYLLLGDLAQEAGSPEDARVMYQTALGIKPQLVEARRKLARLSAPARK